jgi:SAM-dependent methyltransferase
MREQRLIFGEDAELYDRARPTYPVALIETLVSLAGHPARVLELGCGTAKATVLLAESGLTGIAVEPDPAMAAVARRHLDAHRWSVEISDFETWEPAAATDPFDLVCCAQAWHWLDPEVRWIKAHDLLRPGGWLALWWNRPDEDPSSIATAMDDVYGRLAPDLPTRGIGTKGAPDLMPPGASFDQSECRAFRWTHDYTAAAWVELLQTQSDHRMLPPEQLRDLGGAIARAINDRGGIYRHPYVSWLWTFRRSTESD